MILVIAVEVDYGEFQGAHVLVVDSSDPDYDELEAGETVNRDGVLYFKVEDAVCDEDGSFRLI